MKGLYGGHNAAIGSPCVASATCPNGQIVTCQGVTSWFGGDGSNVGCASHDGIGVDCWSGGNNHIYSGNSCIQGIINSN